MKLPYIKNLLLLCSFIIYLILPAIYAVTVFVQTSDSVNINLFTSDSLSLSHIQNIASKRNIFQNWMDDSLQLRNWIIKNFNYAYWRYLGLSIYPQEVIVGRDGWLFSGKSSLDQFTGKKLFSPKHLENWVEAMEARQEWLAEQGISFYIIFAPTQYYVYPEKLPFWVRKSGYSSIGQLFDRLSMSSLKYYDGLDVLHKKKKNHRLYTTADIHWTDSGAWFVFKEVEKEFKRMFPRQTNWPAISASDYKKYSPRDYFCSTSRKLLKFDDLLPCPWESPILEGISDYTFSGKDAWKFRERGNEDVRIWPNHTTVTVHNRNGNNGIKALVIGDSFTAYISSYLNRFFSEVSYDYVSRVKNDDFKNKVIGEKPDIVVYIINYAAIMDDIYL